MGADPPILLDQWKPIAPTELGLLMRDAKFSWCLAGGYAIERFVGEEYRKHADTDISVFRSDQIALRKYLQNWELYAADPPGRLRRWEPGELLSARVHDVWAFRKGRSSWELQIVLQEAERDIWYYRRNRKVRGRTVDFSIDLEGLPCIRIDVQLLYKSKNVRKKDQEDFERCLPLLDDISRRSLAAFLQEAYPNGHEWLSAIHSTNQAS